MASKAVLIVGIGRKYSGDDAVGLVVAKRLQERTPHGTTVITHEGEGVSLMERLAGAGSAILIDAMSSGAEPGAVRRFDANARPLPVRAFRHSTHAFGVADALELGRALQQLPRRLIVYGIEGRSFTAGDSLSPEVKASVPRIVDQVLQEIQSENGRKQ
jgi:hydrogenase maturation protease